MREGELIITCSIGNVRGDCRSKFNLKWKRSSRASEEKRRLRSDQVKSLAMNCLGTFRRRGAALVWSGFGNGAGPVDQSATVEVV